MSLADMHGWVEVKSSLWLPLIDATTLIYGRYTGRPLQLPDTHHEGELIRPAHAGLPDDATDTTRADAERLQRYAWGPCWLTYAELDESQWHDRIRGEWEVLFSLMEVAAIHFGPENVRLIIWATS